MPKLFANRHYVFEIGQLEQTYEKVVEYQRFRLWTISINFLPGNHGRIVVLNPVLCFVDWSPRPSPGLSGVVYSVRSETASSFAVGVVDLEASRLSQIQSYFRVARIRVKRGCMASAGTAI